MEGNENDEDLTPELTEKLILFQEVSGIEDLNRCKAILRQFSWNIEEAINSTMHDTSIPQNPIAMTANQSQASQLRRRIPPVANQAPPPLVQNEVHFYRSPRQTQQPSGFFGWTYFVIALPFRFTFSTFLSIFRFVVSLFTPDSRRRVTNPRGDVIGFITSFKEKYGTNTPDFFEGTYAEGLSHSRTCIKFFIVYLHSNTHEDTDEFCTRTLCNNEVIALLNRNSVFWACSVDTPEGYRVSKTLRESSYPFLAVICQLDGRMTVIGRMEGPLNAEELIEQVSAIIDKYEPALIMLRADRAERDQTQRIRTEQDAAYQESLKRDMEKEKQKKEREETEQRKREAEEQKEKEKINAEELYKLRKKECLINLPNEPDPSDENSICLVVKLPDGTRLKRCFSKNDTIETLHNYVYSQENTPKQIALMHTYPRKPVPFCNTEYIFSCSGDHAVDSPDVETSQKERTLEEAGVKNSEVLFVQSTMEETDESDS